MSRFTWAEKAEEVSKAIRMIDRWLLDHGHKRPTHDVEPKQHRRDLSNTIKAVEDLLVSMAVIEDDSLVQRLSIQWVAGGEPCTVLVQQAEESLAA